MKKTITTTILACLALAAGIAAAEVTKASFLGVTLPDGTVGNIYAGSKITNKAMFTQCDYQSVDGKYLGAFGSNTFATTDATALENFCLAHYNDRLQ
ncbi:MAG TPA: hypothetical protein VFJ62_20780 [Usitatibacter sp.]|nr:hypothetical protein [Usitatibacter sp.]